MDALALIVGVVLGAAVAIAVVMLRSRRDREVAHALLDATRQQQVAELERVVGEVKTAFAALSREALSANADDFLKLAGAKFTEQTSAGAQQLESKKKLIDATLEHINAKLNELANLTHSVERERKQSFGEIKSELVRTSEFSSQLQQTTAQLREALASSQRRGQWGERMADDVLQAAGLTEGVNYRKQATEASGERPDFTFLLPGGLRLNMDVKFPLDNYVRAIEADDPATGKQFQSAFLRDVRNRIKSVVSRAYIDPDGGTLDCVLVFIPNEQVYSFIHQHDATLLDDAMRQKVVLCSPLSLYAVLAVIRQSVDTFRLERTSNEILELLGSFQKEWRKFCEVIDKMGKSLESAMQQFEALQGARSRQLDRQLDRVEALRTQRRSSSPDPAGASALEQQGSDDLLLDANRRSA